MWKQNLDTGYDAKLVPLKTGEVKWCDALWTPVVFAVQMNTRKSGLAMRTTPTIGFGECAVSMCSMISALCLARRNFQS